MPTYCVKTSTEPSSASTVSNSSSSRASLPERAVIRSAPPGGCSSFRNRAGWSQICFSEVSSLRTRPRRPMPSAASMASIDSRTTASYNAACSRVRGTGWSVSVFGGSSGTMPGSDFFRRSRKGRISRARRSTAWSSSPFSTARACRARKDFRGPSSPGVVQSRRAHSSERLFSTGVPVSATRAGDGIVRRAFAVAE